MKPPALRCAIYTRVSTDSGLDQEFNSLDNQREAAEAYVKSQAHEGWRLLRDRYDDGGFSGGSTERPALQRLLSDVRSGRVDVIVVYKVDRLTRSLADFAKLVELFDGHGVSFLSVTQAFNTTTSMGRLTLNVLLSFAQFEREVTGERIRDKIAASKRRGLWVGGMVPLGYRVESKKLDVVEDEAERVRLIFRLYLELGSLGPLLTELRARGVLSKVRRLSGDRTIGGIPFTRGPLAYLLHNRFYIGEISFKGTVYAAEHPAILDRELFEAVQRKLAEQRVEHGTKRGRSDALLAGLLHDDRGHRMTPTHARKKGLRHRYYISSALLQGRGTEAGAIRRVSAPELEGIVVSALRKGEPDHQGSDRELVATLVERIDLTPNRLVLHLRHEDEDDRPAPISVPWRPVSATRHRSVIEAHEPQTRVRPMRSETRATLLGAIAKGRSWLGELVAGKADPDSIAIRERCSVRQVGGTVSLAFLAPDIVQAAIDGRLPHGAGLRELMDAPPEWSRQRHRIGLN